MAPKKKGKGKVTPGRRSSTNSSGASPPGSSPASPSDPPPEIPSNVSSPLSSIASPPPNDIPLELEQLPPPVMPSSPPQPQTQPSTSKSLPASSFAAIRARLRSELKEAVRVLASRREEKNPFSEEEISQLVEKIVDAVGRPNPDPEVLEDTWRKETRRLVIDKGLEEMLFDIALHPSDEDGDKGGSDRYGLLCDVMDVILTFEEREYADATLPLSCIGHLLDLQTISGCHHTFNYIESRVERLTKGMHPQRGKGILLLRLLNELLRRLPKSKTEDVIFSGRILMFLSNVFPLGEKSGVNLRGNFNIAKGTLIEEKEKDDVDMKDKTGAEVEDFHSTFWSLQRFFTNPPLLFAPTPPTPTSPPMDFPTLRHSLNKTLDAFSTATQREKELSGGKDSSVESDIQKKESAEQVLEHYFFPKFLTSRNLLDLEIADPAFRRQILVQMLVLYQYLLSFTAAEREKAIALGVTNNVALTTQVLPPENEKWLVELKSRTLAEMQSMKGGAQFRHTVELILKREQNWINWKLLACQPFEKPPLSPDVSSIAVSKLAALMRKPKPYMYKLGNPILSNLWLRNTTTLDGCVPRDGSAETFDDLAHKHKITSRKLSQCQATKERIMSLNPADKVQKMAAVDKEIEELTIRCDALHWRAIREASKTHLHLFIKIGAGDLDLLVAAIEAERQAQEAAQEAALAVVEQGPSDANDEKREHLGNVVSPKRERDDTDASEIDEIAVKKVKVDEVIVVD